MRELIMPTSSLERCIQYAKNKGVAPELAKLCQGELECSKCPFRMNLKLFNKPKDEKRKP